MEPKPVIGAVPVTKSVSVTNFGVTTVNDCEFSFHSLIPNDELARSNQ